MLSNDSHLCFYQYFMKHSRRTFILKHFLKESKPERVYVLSRNINYLDLFSRKDVTLCFHAYIANDDLL